MSKFSNHLYSNHIHLVLHMLKANSGMGYQKFFEWVENFTGLWELFELDQVPHFTTLQKFVGRCPKRYLDIFIKLSGIFDNPNGHITAIDSTGFSLTNASIHYTVVIRRRIFEPGGRPKRGRPRTRQPIRRFLKTTLVVDIETLTILAVCLRRGPSNDNKDFRRAFKGLENDSEMEIIYVLADKGYDSEANHEYVHEILEAESIIPARENRSKDYRTRGKYRSLMRTGYDENLYHQRNMVETVNSVIKRRMRDYVRARTIKNQNREIIFMVMAYNIEKGLSFSLFVFIGFLESHITNKLLKLSARQKTLVLLCGPGVRSPGWSLAF
jgi:hypothetical protein